MASLKHKAGLPKRYPRGFAGKKRQREKEDSTEGEKVEKRPVVLVSPLSSSSISPSRPLFLPLYHQPLIPSPTLPEPSPHSSSLYTYFGTYLDTPIRWPCIDCGIFSPSASLFSSFHRHSFLFSLLSLIRSSYQLPSSLRASDVKNPWCSSLISPEDRLRPP